MNYVAVVNGAGRGIGRAIAVELALRGCRVVVNDTGGSFDGRGVDSTVAQEVVAHITAAGGTAHPNTDSVATMRGAESLIGGALEQFGAVDILVNNAGITRQNMVWDMTELEFDDVVATNLKGVFACTKAAARHMIGQRSGSIINMASGVSIAGSVATSNYCASKAAVVGFSFATAMELGPIGIRVNVVFPAGHSRLHTKPEPWRDRYRTTERPPMSADDWPVESVLPTIVYLASDDSREINGQLFAAGGASIGWYDTWRPTREVPTPPATDADAVRDSMQTLLAGVANPSPAQAVAFAEIVWPWVRAGALPTAHDAAR
jgi:3-oxoacyl-[acyl-carrier protein] reductase